MAKGKGWHGDSAGHARAAKKRGRKRKGLVGKKLAKGSKCCNYRVVFNNATGDYVCSGCRSRTGSVLKLWRK